MLGRRCWPRSAAGSGQRAEAQASPARTPGKPVRSTSSARCGSSVVSARRLIQTALIPILAAGSMSWKRLAATCTWPAGVGAGLQIEAAPMPRGGLVGASLGGGDRELERNADCGDRRREQVGIGVGEDRQLPTL